MRRATARENFRVPDTVLFLTSQNSELGQYLPSHSPQPCEHPRSSWPRREGQPIRNADEKERVCDGLCKNEARTQLPGAGCEYLMNCHRYNRTHFYEVF